ncbi:MAG: glycosyltransferase family 4 protein [Deltaproteobacteria bacterium]|nr:glycosyltransferase family 4 protein [Deltaproteobacteria bacterium]
MRILLFTQQLAAFRSGVGTYAHGLITGLMELGHQITVVVPEGESIEMPDLRIHIASHSRFDPTPGGWLSLGVSFAKILSNEAMEYDIAHFSDAREAWCVRNSPIPVTGMINDSYAQDWLDVNFSRNIFADRYLRGGYYWLLRVVEKYTYCRMNAVVVNSKHVGRKVINNYRIDPKKVCLIYIGLPDQPPVFPIPLTGSPSILFVGSNFQRKGLPVLLKATAQLLPRFPDLRVHVVGKDRNQSCLMTQARELGIAEAVEFHGLQPNDYVRGMMIGADVFALPSFTEGFGLVYLEAMRAGTPVIATSMGGAKEVFVDGKEALFVDPGEEKGLAMAIKKITSSPNTACRLRKWGQAAAKRFTVDAMGKATEKLFLEALKRTL